jgi:C4-dicarboxylate-specific signal transduction histidine kinase
LNSFQAIEAASHKSGTLIISAQLQEENKVSIRISDNGVGASQSVLDQAFLPFYTTKGSGTGLGLVVALQLTTLFKGTITLRSNRDHDGCTAEIVLYQGNNGM